MLTGKGVKVSIPVERGQLRPSVSCNQMGCCCTRWVHRKARGEKKKEKKPVVALIFFFEGIAAL